MESRAWFNDQEAATRDLYRVMWFDPTVPRGFTSHEVTMNVSEFFPQELSSPPDMDGIVRAARNEMPDATDDELLRYVMDASGGMLNPRFVGQVIAATRPKFSKIIAVDRELNTVTVTNVTTARQGL